MSGQSKNNTLKGGTSPYSLSTGVPPPRGCKKVLRRVTHAQGVCLGRSEWGQLGNHRLKGRS